MSETLQHDWISLNSLTVWEEELDGNAPPGATDEQAYRHRLYPAPGRNPGDWQPGRPPD